MINSVEITNFRCFKHLPPTAFKRFNVIVGESGSGKTSLMEALFLSAGASPEIYLRLRNWRGMGATLSVTGTRESYESIFRDLFYNFRQELGATISCPDTSGGLRSVEIRYEKQTEYTLPLEGIGQNAFLIDPIVFKWDVNGKIYRSALEYKEGKFSISGAAPVSPLVYSNQVNTNASQNANAFSALSRHFNSHLLADTLSKIFPEVKDVTLEILSGEPTLYVNSGLSERLPVADVSGGISKFISLVLFILANPGGTILVDEVESGFYFERLPAIWRALVDLASRKEIQTQLVVTTHSYEFLKAATDSLQDKEIADNTQLMRLERGDDGEHIVRRIKSGPFEKAIHAGLEIRG